MVVDLFVELGILFEYCLVLVGEDVGVVIVDFQVDYVFVLCDSQVDFVIGLFVGVVQQIVEYFQQVFVVLWQVQFWWCVLVYLQVWVVDQVQGVVQ